MPKVSEEYFRIKRKEIVDAAYHLFHLAIYQFFLTKVLMNLQYPPTSANFHQFFLPDLFCVITCYRFFFPLFLPL